MSVFCHTVCKFIKFFQTNGIKIGYFRPRVRFFHYFCTMENPYIKQFPQLMAGKKILYVHGFASSGQSGTVSRMRTVMPQATVIAPDLPLHPQEAIDQLRRVCQQEQPHLIVGTSMGGMYTEMLRGYDRIMVNPALQMGDTMVSHNMMGAQHFQNPRQDGVQDFIVTKALVKEYKEITTHCFEGIDEDERRRVTGLFGDEDTTVDTFDLFHRHYPRAIRFHGEHRMDDRSFMQSVLPVIRWVDDCQEQRSRPVILVAFESLIDSWGKARGSAQKAYRWLAETYSLYIVAPSLPNEPAQMGEVTRWVEQYINVPAWGRIIFTAHKQLLLGDYLIDPAADSELGGFMGTHIRLGDDTFKTWDEVITFFERLGGQ